MNLEKLSDLTARGFFRVSPLRNGYFEKVRDRSVVARTGRGKKVILTGYFIENAPEAGKNVQYHDGRQFHYLSPERLSVVETIPPTEGKPAS